MARFKEACRAMPPPGKQLSLNGRPIDPTQPLRRCGEWVQEVLQKVISEGLVVE
jgi:hypothetical protein